MTKLYKFTPNAFNWLASNIENNKDFYEDPHADFAKLLQENMAEYREPTEVIIKGDIRLKPPGGESAKKSHLADSQALDFYDSLEGMTPRLAANPEILAYINHFYLHGYGILRWPQSWSATFVSNIRNHWLTTPPSIIS